MRCDPATRAEVEAYRLECELRAIRAMPPFKRDAFMLAVRRQRGKVAWARIYEQLHGIPPLRDPLDSDGLTLG